MHLSEHPLLLTVERFNHLFCKGYRSARRSVEFVNVMCLFHLYTVLGEAVHNLCQIFIYGTENGNAEAEVRSPEERLALLRAKLTDFGIVLFAPACRTTNYLYALLKGAADISKCRRGIRKFDGHIRTAECVGIKVRLVVYIYLANNFMSP